MVNAMQLFQQKAPIVEDNTPKPIELEIDIPLYMTVIMKMYSLNFNEVKSMKLGTFWYLLKLLNNKGENNDSN